MAKTTSRTQSVIETYVFNSEKGKSWRYDNKDSDVASALYLKKSRWSKQPGNQIVVTFQVEEP